MGVAHYVVLEQQIAGVDTFMNGKALAHADFEDECEKPLAQIADEIGVTPLTAFLSMDQDTLLGYMDLSREDAPQEVLNRLPAEEWFDPADGLATVHALAPYLKANPTVVPNADWVIADLMEIERLLTAARDRGIRWHLAVDA